MRVILALVVAAICLPAPALAEPPHWLLLAKQTNYADPQGFYISFEGGELATLPLILAVGDGANWRYPAHTPGFEFARDYQMRAVISPTSASLALDGVPVAQSPGAWQPSSEPLEVCYRPSWAAGTNDWLAAVSALSITVTRGGEEAQRLDFDWAEAAARPIPLQLFEPGQFESAALDTQAGDTVTVEAAIRFVSSELAPWAPFVDPYGQCRYADWPEKIAADEDLATDLLAEEAELAAMPPSADLDQYGGFMRAAWQEQPTGFYRVMKRDGHWWLITPTGYPCFYLGCCTAPAQKWPQTPVTGREFLFEWLPPRTGAWSDCWGYDAWGLGDGCDYVGFHTANLIRKYGEAEWWDRTTDQAVRRLRSFGFNGGGKWGAPDSLVSTPVLRHSNTPNLIDHPDIFDSTVRSLLRQDLEAQILPQRDDPLVLGWTVGSEYSELITAAEIPQILALPAATPGKRALLDYALDTLYGGSLDNLSAAWGITVTTRQELYNSTPTPPADDVELLRCHYEDQYHEFLYQTVKSIDPNHLYLGTWLVIGWWENEEDWRIIARHCDVMSYDRYALAYGGETLLRLQAETDKPTFCGEFSFPAWYHGERGLGRYNNAWAGTEAEAGDLYCDWVQAAANDSSCVGLLWFHYRDQPVTGRDSGSTPTLVFGEHYAFGLVTIADQVKWPLVRRMREANEEAARWRLAASGRPFPDVPPDHWAAAEIAACAAAGIVAGFPNGTYQPDLAVSREQMAIYIARVLAGGDEKVPTGPAEATFPDVATDSVAYKYVEYAYGNGIVQGYVDGLYHPERQVDRGQMAVFVARAMVRPTGEAGLVGYDPPETPTFADVTEDVANPYSVCYPHVEYIAEHDVTHGYPDLLYHPERVVTRGLMAIYVARAFGLPV